MQEIGNNSNRENKARIVIRLGADCISCSASDPQAPRRMAFECFEMKSGVSQSANLREAFKTLELLMSGYGRALVMVDAPTMLIPINEFDQDVVSDLFKHSFTTNKCDDIHTSFLTELGVVACFPVNNDVRLVIEDHFKDSRFIPAVQPVWLHLYRRSITGLRTKVYAYFHDYSMDVFCYANGRFKYSNKFEVGPYQNALYFLLYVWRQLGLNNESDEMHIAGSYADSDTLIEKLRQHVRRVYKVSPSAEFNRAPITAIDNVPYDVMAFPLSGK